jgi:zinc-ribbon domain
MFCPKCATQNVDGASFCRSCGANISLVPQALNGQLPTALSKQDIAQGIRRKLRREPSLDSGIRHFMMGLAFIIVSIMVGKYSPGGWTWWYWLLIPASTFIGRGISEIIRAPRQIKTTDPVVAQPQMTAGSRLESLPSLRTGELRAPVPSVTEGTTRHLGAEARTRHFDPVTGEEKFP